MDASELSEDLRPIYLLELRLGNEVARVDRLGGAENPLAVVFKHPLHFAEIGDELELAPGVVYWECHDTHYPLEEGYGSKETRDSVAGPMRSPRRRRV